MSDDITLRIGGTSAGAQAAVSELRASLGALPREVAASAQAATSATSALESHVQRISAKFNQATIDARLQGDAYVRVTREMGGAAALTADQHKEVTRAIQQANDAYRALGQQAPPHIKALEQQLGQTNTTTGKLKSGITEATVALRAFMGLAVVQQASQIIGAVTNTASAVKDLSMQTGIGAESIHRLQLAADPFGVSITQVTGAISNMSDRIASGDKSAVAAYRELGTSAEQLKAQKPDAAFLTIIQALLGMEDQMDRTRLARDAFGESGTAVLRLLDEQFLESARNGEAWSARQINQVDKAGKAWKRLGNDIKTAMGLAIASTYDIASGEGSDPWSLMVLALRTKLAAAQNLTGTTTPFKAGYESPSIESLGGMFGASAPDATGPDRLADARHELEQLTAAQLSAIETNRALGDAVDVVAQQFGVSADAIRLHEQDLQAATRATKDHREEQDRLFKAHQAAFTEWQRIIRAITDYSTAVSRVAQRDFLQGVDEKIRATARANLDALTTINAKNEEVADLQRRRTMSTLEYELDALMRKGNKEKQENTARMAMMGASWDLALAAEQAIDRATAAGMESVILQSDQAKAAIIEVANQLAMLPGMQGIAAGLRASAGGGSGLEAKAPGASWIPKNLGAQLSQILVGTFQSGGNLTTAQRTGSSLGGGLVSSFLTTEGMSKMLSSGIFGAAGGLLGSAVPVVGTLVGGLVGKWLGGMFGPSKTAVANREATGRIQDTKTRLEDRYGSIDTIAGMTRAGQELKAGWQHQGTIGEAAFNKLVKDFEASLERQRDLLADQADKTRELADLEERRAALADSLIPKAQEVTSILDEFGISVEGSGAAVKQLLATDGWTTMINKIQTLERAGIDSGHMINGMADEISLAVQQALKFGTEVPANMRHYIDALMAAGLLVDENGQKITDLSNLKWGDKVATEADKTQAEMDALDATIQGLRDALDEIVHALRDLLPAAAEAGADGIETAVNRAGRTVRVATRGMQDDFADTEDAATGTAHGHSPTGIKEITIVSTEAGKAVEHLGKISYKTFSTIEETAAYWAHHRIASFDTLGEQLQAMGEKWEDLLATPAQRQFLALDRTFAEQRQRLEAFKDDARYSDAVALLDRLQATEGAQLRAEQAKAEKEEKGTTETKLQEKLARIREKAAAAMELGRQLAFTQGQKLIGEAAMGSTLGVVASGHRASDDAMVGRLVRGLVDGQPRGLDGAPLSPQPSPTFVVNTWNADGFERAVRTDIWPRLLDMIRRNDAGALSQLRLALGMA